MVVPKEFVELKQRQQFFEYDGKRTLNSGKKNESKLNVVDIQSPKSGAVHYSLQARPSKILRQKSSKRIQNSKSPHNEDQSPDQKLSD